MYFKKEPKRGYNAYIDTSVDDLGMLMDIGLLVLEPGDTYVIEELEKETAVLLFEGAVTMRWAGSAVEANRPDTFRSEGYCLLCPRRVKIELVAHGHAELFIQQTENARDYAPVLYTPETVQVQHAGANGELMGAMRREIKTLIELKK